MIIHHFPVRHFALRVESPGGADVTVIVGARDWSVKSGGRAVYIDGRRTGRDVSHYRYSPMAAARSAVAYAPGQLAWLNASDVRTRKPFPPELIPLPMQHAAKRIIKTGD